MALASRARAFGGSRLNPLLAKSVAERVAEIQSQGGMSTLRRSIEKVPGEQFDAVSAQQRFNRCVFPESLLASARARSTGNREPTGGFDFFASEAGIQPRQASSLLHAANFGSALGPMHQMSPVLPIPMSQAQT
jgi:hypothetical protein